MPASILRLVLGWITGLALLTAGACSSPTELDGSGVAVDRGPSGPNGVGTELPGRRLALELTMTPSSRIGVIGTDESWVASLREACGPHGSVTRLDLRASLQTSAAVEDRVFDDVLLVESWTTLVRESEAGPDQVLRWLGERLRDGGRLWIVERRFGTGSARDGQGAAWPLIVDTARLAGFAIRRVDVNRLEDHLLVQVEKRNERLHP